MELTPAQIDAIADNIAGKMRTQRSDRVVSNEEHNEHHLFIKQLKLRIDLDDESKRKIIESGKIWAFILFLGFTGAALWTYFIQAIEKGAGS